MRENLSIECLLNSIFTLLAIRELIYKFSCLFFQVLAARVSTAGKSLSQLRGTIAVNGQRRVESKFRKISAYVLQVFILQ